MGYSLMVPDSRLLSWDTVVRCGSKLGRTPVSRTLWINLVHAVARQSKRREVQGRLSLSPFSAHPQLGG